MKWISRFSDDQKYENTAGHQQFLQAIFKKLSIFIFFTLIVLASNLDAQKLNYKFEKITIQDGLSQSSVYAAVQDKKGFLWFGTQDGLNKFDGAGFTVYRHIDGDENSLSDNWINDIAVDKTGNLWIGTSGGGLNKYDQTTENFSHYGNNPENPKSLGNNIILDVFVDSENTLWVGTDGGGLSKFDRNTDDFISYINDTEDNNSLSNNKVQSIYEDRAGNIWVGTLGGGLNKLDKKSGKFTRYKNNPSNPKSLSDNRVTFIYEDNHGDFWVGTEAGLNRFDYQFNNFKRYTFDVRNPDGLSNHVIRAILEDESGVLWIGTDGGLNIYIRGEDRFVSFSNDPKDPTSISSDLIRCLYEDQAGIIWIGNYAGAINKYDRKRNAFNNIQQNPLDVNSLSNNNVWSFYEEINGKLWIGTDIGLNEYNPKTGKYKHYKHDPKNKRSLSNNVVRVVKGDRFGNIWVGTDGGGLNLYKPGEKSFKIYRHDPDDPGSLSDDRIRSVYVDRKGTLWVGTLNGLNEYDAKHDRFNRYQHVASDTNSISDSRVQSIYEDKSGNFWIGTYGGFNYFDRKKDKFKSFLHNPDDPNSISHDLILCIYEDRQGETLWISTFGGLNKFDREKLTFKRYSMEDGLPNNVIYGVLEDKSGHLWLSTNIGLAKFDPENETSKNFDVKDGLQSNEFNGGSYLYTYENEMFFGGINGYTAFTPEDLKDNEHKPPVIITSFNKYDKVVKLEKSISETDELVLSYKDDFFSFEFAALDYSNPEKNQYAYKLEGFDEDWIYCGNRRYASYTNLDGGEYVFRVKGSNNDGVWNEEGTSLKIIIIPPPWETIWFKIIASLLIVGFIFSAFIYSINRVEKQKLKLQKQVDERTIEIRERNKDLIKSKRETDNILDNVEEGLFLLNSKLEIESQYSRSLESILNSEKLADSKFIEMLGGTIPAKLKTSVQEYLELMFDDSIDEETINDLNPLTEIEMNFEDEDGVWYESKHLSFRFKRITDPDMITMELISTVKDITDQIELEQKLEETEAHNKQQMEWMLSVLHVEPTLLKEFMQGVHLELNYIDTVLKQNDMGTDFRPILEKIYRSMHLVKGNASLLDLKFFVKQAHEFEEKVSEILEKQVIKGSDFIPMVMRIGEMRTTLRELKELIDRISNIQAHFRPKRSYENKILIQSVQNLINNVSHDLNKEVNFVYENFDPGMLPYKYRLASKEIIIQLVRNSIYHGIEDRETRLKNSKDAKGTIILSSFKNEFIFGFKFMDDGRGLQIDKLREKARKSGRWTDEQIDSWSDQEVAQTIFVSGISTLEKANLIAGRGVGMDLIKDKVEKAGGRIEINFETDKYCEFIITLPFEKEQDEAPKEQETEVSEA